MNLFPNPTILLMQAVPFLLTLAVLKFMILDPLLEHLIERRDRTVGASDKLNEMAGDIAAAEAEYQERVAGLRKEAAEIRQAQLAEAAKVEQGIIADAQQKTNKELDAFRASLGQVIDAARSDLNADSKVLATQVASSILGRTVEGGAS